MDLTPEREFDAPPRIVAVGFRRLQQLLREVAPDYAAQARVEVLDRGFEAALQEVQALRRLQPVDVLVAAGSNGAYLRQNCDLPVVLVKVGGFDVMRALARARRLSARVALVTYGASAPEFEDFTALFDLGVVQRSYRSEEDARACVAELRGDGVEVVVAPGLVADFAEEAGMHGILLYSDAAVREAIDDAIEIARAARIELAKRERLNAIIGQLREGVVAVDAQERIEAVNPAMQQILGVARAELLGRRLGAVAPELTLQATLRDGGEELEQIQPFGAHLLVTSRMPIRERGVQTGAVLTCQLPESIQRVDRRLRAKAERPARAVRYSLQDIVGSSAPLQQARALALQYAASEATLLIVGESGTGKELFAQGIHAASRRAAQPFVAVNCAAFSDTLLESELFGYEEGAFTGARKSGKIGLFEAAHTGTLFLDEVGEIPVHLQTRLLRALQEREVLRVGATEPTPVDVRVIAATHRDLPERIARGEFRLDLYYRLNILRLELPGLRERSGDLPALAQHLLRKVVARQPRALDAARTPDTLAAALGALLAALRDYAWPGNVRELENLVERLASAAAPELALAGPELLRRIAPEFSPPARAPAEPPGAGQREQALAVLAACGGDRAAACRQLGISRTTLWRRLAGA
jgi:propionate catabolism operon transcriptional regulator